MGNGHLLISQFFFVQEMFSLPDCDGEVMPTGRGVIDLQGEKKSSPNISM